MPPPYDNCEQFQENRREALLNRVIADWECANFGSTVEVFPLQSATFARDSLAAAVAELLDELQGIDLDPFGRAGVNETLRSLAESQVMVACPPPSLRARGANWLSPRNGELAAAATAAGNARLATFLERATADANVTKFFVKVVCDPYTVIK